MSCIYSNDIPRLRKAEGIATYKIPQLKRLQHLASIFEKYNQNKVSHIPNIFHQIWVTSSDNPQELPTRELDLTIDVFHNMLLVMPDFRSVFWTNDPALIPNSIKALEKAGIEVKLINSFGDLSDKNFELISLIKAGQYGKASDIFRYIVIARDGGVYRDVDYAIINPKALGNIMKSTDFFAGYLLEGLLGTGFFGAIPEHSILKDVVFLVNRNFGKDRPAYQDKACNSYSETIMQTGPMVFDIAVAKRFQNFNIHTKDIVFSQGIVYNACQTPLLSWKDETCMYCIDDSAADTVLIGQIGNDNLSAKWVTDSAFVPFKKYKDLKETYHNQPHAQYLSTPDIKLDPTNLSFFLYQISDCNIKDIIQILQNNQHVVSLNLVLQQISSVGAIELANFLKTSYIKDINLGGNSIGDEGTESLAEAIATRKDISSMRLWGNNISDKGAIALADALYAHPSLLHVDMAYNEIGILGASALISSGHSNVDMHIELWGNKIDEQELDHLLNTNQCLVY